jgi:hypothetical protein
VVDAPTRANPTNPVIHVTLQDDPTIDHDSEITDNDARSSNLSFLSFSEHTTRPNQTSAFAAPRPPTARRNRNGVRTKELPDFTESIKDAPVSESLSSCLKAFNDRWVCKEAPHEPSRQLRYLSRKKVEKQRGHNIIKFVCNCKNDNVTRVDYEDQTFPLITIGYRPGDTSAKVYTNEDLFETVATHFMTRPASPHQPPEEVNKFFRHQFQKDPFMTIETCMDTLINYLHNATQGSQDSLICPIDPDLAYFAGKIVSWFTPHGRDPKNTFAMLRTLRPIADYEKNNAFLRMREIPLRGISSYGYSTHAFLEYSNRHSIFRYRDLHRGPGIPFVPFQSLSDFMHRYKFDKKAQVLTIPVRTDWFEGTGFSEDEKAQATNCTIITTPIALWTVHQICHSESHKHLLPWVVDGCYKFARSEQGKGCLFTIGTQIPRTNRRGLVTRTFAPLCHVLMTSESAHCTFVAIKGFFHVLYNYIHLPSSHAPYFIKDLHKGSQAGIRMAFPNAKHIPCSEHMRALFQRNDAVRVPTRAGRIIMETSWKKIFFAPTPQFEDNMMNVFYSKFGNNVDTREFIEYYRTNHGHARLSHSCIKTPGILNDTQSEESYFGKVSGSVNTSTPGVLLRAAGIHHFLSNGIHNLLAYDLSILDSCLPGRWAEDFQHRLPCRSFYARALLLHQDTDVFDMRRLPGRGVTDGFLVRSTISAGKSAISQSVAEHYLHHVGTVLASDFEWAGSFSEYASIGLSFCWVKPVPELGSQLGNDMTHLLHLQHLPNCKYYCNCHDFHQFLVCPSTLFIEERDCSSIISRFILNRHPGSNANHSRDRRPVRRTARTVLGSLAETLNLPAGHSDAALEFIYQCTPTQLTAIARSRGKGAGFSNYSKIVQFCEVIDGTHLGTRLASLSQGRSCSLLPSHSGSIGSFAPVPHLGTDPFPEGTDESNPSRCSTFLIHTPGYSHPVDSRKRPEEYAVSTLLLYALSGGRDFFSPQCVFPYLDSCQQAVNYAKNHITIDQQVDPLSHLLLLEEAMLSPDCLPVGEGLSQGLVRETILIRIDDARDRDASTASNDSDNPVPGQHASQYLPLKSALDMQNGSAETHTLSACLIFQQTGLYIYRIPPSPEDDDEGLHYTESLSLHPVPYYAVFRPQTISYFQHHVHNQHCSITLWRGTNALMEFLDRLLSSFPPGNSFCRVQDGRRYSFARIYMSPIPTECNVDDANFGISILDAIDYSPEGTNHQNDSGNGNSNSNPSNAAPAQPPTNGDTNGVVRGTGNGHIFLSRGMSSTNAHTSAARGTGTSSAENTGTANDNAGQSASGIPPVHGERRRQVVVRTVHNEDESDDEIEDESDDESLLNQSAFRPLPPAANPGSHTSGNNGTQPQSAVNGSSESVGGGTIRTEDIHGSNVQNANPDESNGRLDAPTRHDVNSPSLLLSSESGGSDDESIDPFPIVRTPMDYRHQFPRNHPFSDFLNHWSLRITWWDQWERVAHFVPDDDAVDMDTMEANLQRLLGEQGNETQDVATCCLCLENINQLDDIAVPEGCNHRVHLNCALTMLISSSVPTSQASEYFQLIPLSHCPYCREAKTLYKLQSTEKPIPMDFCGVSNGNKVYARFNMRRGTKCPASSSAEPAGPVSDEVWVEDPMLYYTIFNKGGISVSGFDTSTPARVNSCIETIPHNDLLAIGFKLFLYSIWGEQAVCGLCYMRKPWGITYRNTGCPPSCWRVFCKDCVRNYFFRDESSVRTCHCGARGTWRDVTTKENYLRQSQRLSSRNQGTASPLQDTEQERPSSPGDNQAMANGTTSRTNTSGNGSSNRVSSSVASRPRHNQPPPVRQRSRGNGNTASRGRGTGRGGRRVRRRTNTNG